MVLPDREFQSLDEALESFAPDWTDTFCMMRWREDTTFGMYCRFLQALTVIGCQYFFFWGWDERNRWGPDAPDTVYVRDGSGR